ncbi:hypothetical protein SADUNF_Sadunf03G0015500 [Salix dunnii]|uniref:GED domain-containing protein n=1 Tax=Salix dunnii TaxID=1413687 RepID=A0A835KGQ9_9ROSI|nr:hypothetical protein SADUNF_Sadunf03G0015500 [Salix dunnii]
MSVALKHCGSVSEEERWSSSENQAESLEEKHQELVKSSADDLTGNFMMSEIQVEEASHIPVDFVEKIWTYIEGVIMSVLMHRSQNYHQLQLSTRRAGYNLMEKMKERSRNWVAEIVQMEKVTDYTSDPAYLNDWNELMAQQQEFMDALKVMFATEFLIEVLGVVSIKGLKAYEKPVLLQAFDLKMRTTAYWKIVLRRLVDFMALHLQFCARNLVNKEMEEEIV